MLNITYRVYSKSGNEITMIPVQASTAKLIKSSNRGSKMVQVEAPKLAYYRDTLIIIVEEVTNGYTLANAADGSFHFRHCTTSEIEYR